MKEIIFKKSKAVLWCWVVLSLGAVSSLIFPPFENVFAGYVALVAFFCLLFLKQCSKTKLFGTAYLFGFAFYAVGFSWINNALLVDADRLATFIPLVIFGIGAFFGLFWALPALAITLGQSIYQKMLAFAAAVVFGEWIRSFIFTGFPWNIMGSALSFSPYMIQGAAYIGAYGLSLVLLIFCLGLALLVLSIFHRHFYKKAILFLLIPACFVIVAGTHLNTGKCLHCDEMNDFVVRLVQPSIPQTFKWHPALMYKNFRQYIDLTKKGPEERYLPLDAVRLVVWGETATPYLLDNDEEHRLEIKEAIPQGGFLVTGVLRAGMENGKIVPYNSLYVLDDEANIKDYYDKAHLVPFGEYLPFREYLPDFMHPVADIVGDLGKGEKFKNIRVSGLPLMGGAICYESIFPKGVVNPKEKPEILLVLANDGWYGISAGPYQHLAAAQMRAVEEGVTVIRSANTGISAVIAPNGEIKARIGLNEIGIVDTALNLPLSFPTFYGKYGNAVPLILIFLLMLLAGVFHRVKCIVSFRK